MKLLASIIALISFAVSRVLPLYAALFIMTVGVVYAAYGVLLSSRRRVNSFNDLPNALRVVLAAIGGYLISSPVNFMLPSVGAFLVLLSVYFNDEYQRKVLRAIREGRRGGSVALLGIDGSGKSSHAEALERWFASRGYPCTVVPFHRYLFMERLVGEGRASEPRGGRGGGNPLRPVLSLVDNLVLNLVTSLGSGFEGRVVVYDRFVWSTYVKYLALGYPVRPLSGFYMLPRPRFAFILDVPVVRSLKVIRGRENHIRYESGVLAEEREEYLQIARSMGYPIVDSTKNFEVVQEEIQQKLEKAFPVVRGAIPG